VIVFKSVSFNLLFIYLKLFLFYKYLCIIIKLNKQGWPEWEVLYFGSKIKKIVAISSNQVEHP